MSLWAYGWHALLAIEFLNNEKKYISQLIERKGKRKKTYFKSQMTYLDGEGHHGVIVGIWLAHVP